MLRLIFSVLLYTSKPAMVASPDGHAQAAKHTHGGGFTCPVCTKTKYFSLVYLERNMVNRRKVAKALGEVPGL